MRVCSGRFFYRELNPRLWFNVWTPPSETNTNLRACLRPKWYFPLHTNHYVGLPLCWKAFSKNTAPEQQQHWADGAAAQLRSGKLRKGLPAQWQSKTAICVQRYHFDLYISFQLHAIACFFPSVVPFVGPDGIFTPHYGRCQLLLVRCSDTAGVGLALAFSYLLLRTCCPYTMQFILSLPRVCSFHCHTLPGLQ